MKIFSLNCRGLGNPETVSELLKIVRREDPNIVFLMETRLDSRKLEFLRVRLGMAGCLGVDRHGLGGGLALLWSSAITVYIKNFSHHHIDADVVFEDGLHWRVTGFYGHPERGLRAHSWALLRHLWGIRNLPWLVLGDFNEITDLNEQWGRSDCNLAQMAAFREALSDCCLQDLGFHGAAFTWSNRRLSDDLVRVRLDRGVANSEWISLFPNAQVHHVVVAASDHMGLLISMDPAQALINFRKKNWFRFEHMWVREAGCEDAIREGWSVQVQGSPMYSVVQKIKNCRVSLLNWSRTHVRASPRLIASKMARLEQLENMPMDEYRSNEVNDLRREVNVLMEKEEIFWRQRSRVSWLSAGDRNTKFFHACASQRKRTNQINGLRDENGVMQSDQQVISNIAVECFHQLFNSSRPDCIQEVVNHVDSVVTPDMHESLLRQFTVEEIQRALFQMNPAKAPGPDGMTPLFFQKYWHIIGVDVSNAILDFFTSRRMLGSVNFTNIVLIPKVKNPEAMTQFRPISLCNVLYKIVSKVLVNRMKNILPRVISDSQSVFVPGRLITDNVIMAFEVLHYLKNLSMGNNYQMAAKLDMSKAYDRVEWSYLKAILLKLGFHERWVELIMACVSSTSYSVLVNGSPHGYIKPSRGLRQGDPLSPYLFLICAEGLSALLRKKEREKSMRGIAICRGGSRISHLFFADDSIIFCRASMHECGTLHHVLALYERASGQQINKAKTALFFSKNTPSSTRSTILTMFGTSSSTQFEKYLGLPPIMGRSKRRAFNEIKDRIWKRLQGWKEKLLSQADREILIKAVIQAIPSYAMCCFRFPASLCDEICSMANRFWWGQRGDARKIHWINKAKLIKSKMEGGMGFRDLQLFNKALLGWRLIQEPHALVSRFLKAKYFPNSSFLEARLSSNASYIWRSICESRHVLKSGLRWRVGTRSGISIWNDAWLLSPSTYKVITPARVLNVDATVDSLIDLNLMKWNVNLLKEIFVPRDVEVIQQIPLSLRKPCDKLIWTGTPNGKFTVKSAYNLLLGEANSSLGSSSSGGSLDRYLWSNIWSSQVQPKIKIFMWRACLDILPNRTKLFEKGVLHSFSCQWCEDEPETSSHVLWQCAFVQKIWEACPVPIPASCNGNMSFRDFIVHCTDVLDAFQIAILFTTAWEVWNARNRLLWDNKLSTVDDIWRKAAGIATEFLTAGLCLQDPERVLDTPLESRWRPPDQDNFKLNMSIFMVKESKLVGIGIVVRDAQSVVLAALQQKVEKCDRKIQMHAVAVLLAVQFAYDMGFRRLEVDIPYKDLLLLLQDDDTCFAPIGPLIDDILWIKNSCSFCKFSFVNSVCNKAALALAKEAVSSISPQVWLEDCPASIAPTVISESL